MTVPGNTVSCPELGKIGLKGAIRIRNIVAMPAGRDASASLAGII